MQPTPDDPDAGPTPPLPGESSVAYAMFLSTATSARIARSPCC